MTAGLIYKEQLAWFDLPKDDPKLSGAVIETVKDIERRQTSIFEGNRRHAKLYAGYLPKALNNGAAALADRRPFAATKALVRSICDTATALISKFRPKSTFITTGADWDVQKQAEDMDMFVAGAYERGHLYQTAPRSFHDTTVFGTGAWKLVEKTIGEDDYYVNYERVLPDDLVVDEDECRDTLEPENTYHRFEVKADALIRRYARGDSKADRELRQKIRGAANVSTWPNRQVANDRLILVDAVHVEEDGNCRRVIAFEGGIIKDIKWPFPFHPYVFLWWAPPISGFYGDGVSYRQFGRQERITYLYRWVERCQNLFSTPTAWVDPAGGPPVLQMSNEIGAVVQSRKPPVFQVHQAVQPEIYNWIDELGRGGFEDEGISQASAANILPPGLESAPAQREYSFKESNRFAPVSQRWEHAVAVDTAYKTVAMYRRRAEMMKDKKLTVNWLDRNILLRVDWPDLPTESYQIRPAASSLEALSPSSRLQAAIELSQTGWLRPGEGRRLMGHPDLERSDELDNAGTVYAEMVLKQLLKGEHVDVDEYSDLVVLDQVVRAGRLLAITKHAPAKLIDNCSDFLDRLDKVTADAAAAAMAGGAGGAPGPMQTPSATMATPAAQGMPMPFAGGKG